nr:MAG TPA: hypothetical protein [Caudoviricetes sp.]
MSQIWFCNDSSFFMLIVGLSRCQQLAYRYKNSICI